MNVKAGKILIVEDLEEIRAPLTFILRRVGYDILEASDGSEAIESARSNRPDMILMDISLPEIDGLQATRELRNDKEFREIPIIILSAHDSESSRHEAMQAGATDYFTKPIEFDDLNEMIERYLGKDAGC